MANSADELDFILLKLLAWPATKAKSSTGQLVGNIRNDNRQIRRQTFDNHDERLTVTLSGGQVAQHAL
jgi:hypothetical protein